MDGKNNNTGPETVDIDIPSDVLVSCPKAGFRLARVQNCLACEYFCGVSDRFPGSDKAFGDRFLIACRGAPVMRNIQTLQG